VEIDKVGLEQMHLTVHLVVVERLFMIMILLHIMSQLVVAVEH